MTTLFITLGIVLYYVLICIYRYNQICVFYEACKIHYVSDCMVHRVDKDEHCLTAALMLSIVVWPMILPLIMLFHNRFYDLTKLGIKSSQKQLQKLKAEIKTKEELEKLKKEMGIE